MSGEFLSVEQKISHVEQIVQATPEIAGLQAYEYLRNNAQAQKTEFISYQRPFLDLEYPDIAKAVAKLAAPSLGALKSLMPQETNEKSEALYRTIEYRYSELFMLDLASRMLDPNLSEYERQAAKNWFVKTNEALYGMPQKEVFSALACMNFVPILSEEFDDPDHVLQQGILRDQIGSFDLSDYKPTIPSSETIQRLGQLVRQRFEPLVDHVDEGKTYEVADMREVLEIALDKLGGTEIGWVAKIAPNSSAFAVSAHQKLVEVGEDRNAADGMELKKRILHEVGVHAGRSINAEKAGWLSAAYGQDGYLDFEEAFATALEDAYEGVCEQRGEAHYLAAGFALGLDNHESREFRGVYEIMWRYEYLKAAKEGKPISKEDAESKSFTNRMRIFRGTSTKDRGVIYSKDLAYFNGQELVWPLLAKVKNQQDLDIFFAGKLDLTRPDHLNIAQDILQNQ